MAKQAPAPVAPAMYGPPAPPAMALATWAAAQAACNPAPAPAPAKGGATAARWYGPALRANPQATILTPAQAKALPHDTVITCNVAANPKRGNSNAAFACYFGKQPTQGATTTWGAFIAAILAARLAGNASNAITVAAGHLAWDATRDFVRLTPPSA